MWVPRTRLSGGLASNFRFKAFPLNSRWICYSITKVAVWYNVTDGIFFVSARSLSRSSLCQV